MADANLLHGRIAFITGAAQGIGRAVAQEFIKHGARVVLADIDKTGLSRTVSELGENATGVPLDVTDEHATEIVAQEIFSDIGPITTVIPNAGILLLKHGVDTSPQEFRKVLEINLTGAFITATTFARKMIESGTDGQIIMTSSLFGKQGGRENSAYSASKFGMIGLMQCLAPELARDNISVNCVCPGQMDTDMIHQLFKDRAELTGMTVDETKAKLLSRIPCGQLGKLSDLAGTYVYLASDLCQYVTGQAITVDGGWRVG